jgi:hypothetical protein
MKIGFLLQVYDILIGLFMPVFICMHLIHKIPECVLEVMFTHLYVQVQKV